MRYDQTLDRDLHEILRAHAEHRAERDRRRSERLEGRGGPMGPGRFLARLALAGAIFGVTAGLGFWALQPVAPSKPAERARASAPAPSRASKPAQSKPAAPSPAKAERRVR